MPSEVDAIVTSGVVTFLPKPFAPSQLVAVLRQECSAQNGRAAVLKPAVEEVEPAR